MFGREEKEYIGFYLPHTTPQSSTEVRSEWICTSFPPSQCLHDVSGSNVTFFVPQSLHAALRAVCWTVPTCCIGNVLGVWWFRVVWCKWKCRSYKIMHLWKSDKYHVAQRGVNVITPLYSVAPYLPWNTSVAFSLSFFLQIPLGFIYRVSREECARLRENVP